MNKNKTLTQIILKNSFSRLTYFIFKFIIAFIVTPYMVYRLGIELFGVWTIISVLSSYTHLADMGVGRTLIIFVSKYHVKGDTKKLSEIISSAFGMYIFFSSFTFLILFLSRAFIIENIFKIPEEFINDAFFVYLLILSVFCINIIFSVFTSCINGMQRMEITSSIGILSSFLNAIGVFIVLEFGYGIKGLAVVMGIVSIIIIVFNYYYFKKVLSGININLWMIRLTRIKEIFKFSINVELSYIFRMMLDPLNKILISYFGSLSLVAFYEIGFRMINLATNAFQSLTGSILPAITKMNTESGLEKVKPMFHYSSKYVSFFAIPVFALIFILSKPFVETWMGPGFETSIVTLQIMILPYMVGILTNPAFLCIQAIGYPQYAMTVVAIRGILNLVLGYIFIRVFGYYGLLIAIALASFISSICIEIILHRVIKTSILNTLFVIINKITIVNLFVSIILFIFINYINPNGYFNLILCAILYLGFSTSLMFFISWLDDKDRQILKPILPVTIYSKLT